MKDLTGRLCGTGLLADLTMRLERNNMNKEKYYVVTMYRFANRESHSYVLGVWNNKHAANEAAEAEQIYRGGNKYFPEVLEYDINKPSSEKQIIPLETM